MPSSCSVKSVALEPADELSLLVVHAGFQQDAGHFRRFRYLERLEHDRGAALSVPASRLLLRPARSDRTGWRPATPRHKEDRVVIVRRSVPSTKNRTASTVAAVGGSICATMRTVPTAPVRPSGDVIRTCSIVATAEQSSPGPEHTTSATSARAIVRERCFMVDALQCASWSKRQRGGAQRREPARRERARSFRAGATGSRPRSTRAPRYNVPPRDRRRPRCSAPSCHQVAPRNSCSAAS